MTSARAEEILQEIGREGSDLNQKYRGWRDNAFSTMIFDLMFHLSTPDKVAETVTVAPNTDPAPMLLGVCTGRARSIDMIQSLDTLVPAAIEEMEETFEQPAIGDQKHV